MSLSCEEFVDLMLDYVGEELSADHVERIKHHLCGCQSCGDSLDSYRLTIVVTRALRRCDPHPLPPAFATRLRAAMGVDAVT